MVAFPLFQRAAYCARLGRGRGQDSPLVADGEEQRGAQQGEASLGHGAGCGVPRLWAARQQGHKLWGGDAAAEGECGGCPTLLLSGWVAHLCGHHREPGPQSSGRSGHCRACPGHPPFPGSTPRCQTGVQGSSLVGLTRLAWGGHRRRPSHQAACDQELGVGTIINRPS